MIPATYQDWRVCITVKCGLTLDATFIAERLQALRTPDEPMTRRFRALYGEQHLCQTIAWFEQAQRELAP